MNPRFFVQTTPLPDLRLVERQRRGDSRGYLERLFCADELADAGWRKPIMQINHTYTFQKGAVRGMHFQFPPFAEMKLVMCVKGKVFDVAVDLRNQSPTFLQWHGVYLSYSNGKAMLIPKGFAHGFQTLTPDVEMIYFHSAPYSPEAEGGLHPQDPQLNITWPMEIADLSPRDAAHQIITANYEGIRL